MRHYPGLVMSLLLAGCAAPDVDTVPSVAVHLFDCSGRIQVIDQNDEPGAARRVAELDSTLPSPVRDGCAIHAGRYDQAGQLVLQVQTAGIQDSAGRLPTRFLVLSTPALEPVASRSGATAADGGGKRTDTSMDRALAANIETIESPFRRSVGYLSGDRATLLLQEVTDTALDGPASVRLDFFWKHGSVRYQRPHAAATGRFAVVDVATHALVGQIVSVEGPSEDHRVVCFTPGGRVFLAAARDSLLVLHTRDPSRRSTIRRLTVDLHYAACAAGSTAGS